MHHLYEKVAETVVIPPALSAMYCKSVVWSIVLVVVVVAAIWLPPGGPWWAPAAPTSPPPTSPIEPLMAVARSPRNFLWAIPSFLHESFPHAMDPNHGAHLDMSCNIMPTDGQCVTSSEQDNNTCLLGLHRAAHNACAFPRVPGDLTQQRDDLCPCRWKRTATVRSVFFVAKLNDDGTARHKRFFAVTPNVSAPRRNGDAEGSNVLSTRLQFAIVDATSPEFNNLGCMFGQQWALAKMRVGVPLVAALSEKLARLSVGGEQGVARSANGSKERAQSDSQLNACDALWGNPLAVRWPNITREMDGVPTVTDRLFYALESGMTFPGHAAALLASAIGQYVSEGLDKDGVPWLVPCSSAPNVPSPIWTHFFLQLNEALQFPIRPFDLHREVATTPGDLVDDVLRFDHLVFVNFNAEWNQVCFKPVLLLKLWPTVLKLALAKDWDAPLHASLAEPAPQRDEQPANNESAVGHALLPRSPKRIAFMKITGGGGSATSPHRSHPFSARFNALLREHDIVPIDPTTPLLERMWHVNTAELVVTTWGSAMATLTSLMMPRRTNASQGNETSQHRILVLVHPAYCHEAIMVLPTTWKACPKVARAPARYFHGELSVVRGRTPTDFIGGPLFCAKYLMVASLRSVTSRDLTFMCSRN